MLGTQFDERVGKNEGTAGIGTFGDRLADWEGAVLAPAWDVVRKQAAVLALGRVGVGPARLP